MKKLFCFLAGCLLFLASGPALRAQTPSASADSLMRQFQQVAGYDQRWTREQVFVHLDNNGYFEGETIWFSAYVVRASTLRPTKLSRVLYVELLNAAGDVMERRKVRIDHEGRASGDIKLDAQTVRSGFYEIRAYTRAMLNWDTAAAFSRVVPVFRKPAEDTADGELVIGDAYAAGESPSQRPKKDDDPFLLAAQSEDGVLAAFYPEGGQRVEGQPSLVAFRLTDKRGNPIEATCRAYDTGGQLLATASAVHEGMGSFTLPATAGAAYATVEHGGTTTRFDLPAPVPGYALSATWASADSLRLTVAGSASLAGRLLGLSVTARGRACFFDTIAVAGAAPVERLIPRAALGAGVCQATLVDGSGRVLAERLVWNDPPPALRLAIRQNQTTYSPCSPVALEMELTDNEGRPRRGTFSLAVRDRGGELVARDGGIRESLLLSSDVRGYIARPEYYFAADDSAHRHALDLLLLVQGWRRYDWQEMAGIVEKKLAQPVEDGILVDGRAVTGRKKGIGDAQMRVRIYLANEILKGECETDKHGEFAFRSHSFFGEGIGDFLISRKGQPITGFVALNRNFAPTPRFIGDDERQLRKPLAPQRQNVPEPALFAWTDTLPKASITLSEAMVSAEGFDDYATGRYSWGGGESAGKQYADLYYNVEDELERYMDEGNSSPLIWDWLYERNKNFYFSIDAVDAGTGHAETDAGARGSTLIPGFRVEYKGRPVAIVLDNEVLGAKREGFIDGRDATALMADEIKSIVITEDPVAYQRFVLPKVGGSLSENASTVTIFLYSNPGTNVYKNRRGRRITRIHGYSIPSKYYHPNYRMTDVPTANDHRRTLYWNPAVHTDESGKASAVFFSNSRDGLRLTFSAQGVQPDGRFVDLEL